jgi:hypothetical protein
MSETTHDPTLPRTIAVLTSGGDAPGMNAAVRAVVGGPRRPRGRRGDGSRGRRRPHRADGLGLGGRHPPHGRHGDRHRPVGPLPHARGPTPGRRELPEGRHRQPGRDRRRRQPERRRRPPPGVEGPRGGARRDRGRRPRDRGEGDPVQHRRPRRLHRQRHVRHRHHDRRRHRAPPDHGGGRRHRLHGRQPPAHLRRRGDGPQLRVPLAHGRDRHRRELGPHPREPPGRGRLGSHDVRAAPHRTPGWAAGLDRDRGRGRPGPPREPDHRRARPQGPARAPPRGRPDHDPRPRPARGGAERLRSVHEHAARVRRGRGAPLLASGPRAAAHRLEGQPGHPPAAHAVRGDDEEGRRVREERRLRRSDGPARPQLRRQHADPAHDRARPAPPPRPRPEAFPLRDPARRRPRSRDEHRGPRRAAARPRQGPPRPRRAPRVPGARGGRPLRDGLDDRQRLGEPGGGRARHEPPPVRRPRALPGRAAHREERDRRHPHDRRRVGLPGDRQALRRARALPRVQSACPPPSTTTCRAPSCRSAATARSTTS